MIDTYLKSRNKDSLEQLHCFAQNVIGPVQGTSENIWEDGSSIPAKGDPDYWYACVRFLLPITPYADIEACDQETGVAVCGVWA